MSIRSRIEELEQKGGLKRYVPVEAVPEMREIITSRTVTAFIECLPGVPKKLFGTAGASSLLFDSFVAGGQVTFGMDPRSHTGALIARNDPLRDRICDFRVLQPEPSVRIFGAFAERDVFVALTYQPRARLTNVFQNAVGVARKQWDLMFPDHQPVYSDGIQDYVGQPYFAC